MASTIDEILDGLRGLRADLSEARGDRRREADRQQRAGRARDRSNQSTGFLSTLPAKPTVDPRVADAARKRAQAAKERSKRRAQAAERWNKRAAGEGEANIDRILSKDRSFKILGDKKPKRSADSDSGMTAAPTAKSLTRLKLLTKREPNRRETSDRDKNMRDRIAREVSSRMEKAGISKAGRPPTKLPAIAKQYDKLIRKAVRTGLHAAQQGNEALQAKRRRGGAPKTNVKAKPKKGKGRPAKKTQRKLEKGGKAQHGAGSGAGGKPGRGGRTKQGDPGFGEFDRPYDPDAQTESMMHAVGTGLYEDVLQEATAKVKAKRQARRIKQLRRQGDHAEADRLEAKHKAEKPGGGGKGGKRSRYHRFHKLRREGKLAGHKDKGTKTKKSKKTGKMKSHKKYENETSFKKCKEGALISSKYLRDRMAKDRFVNQDDDYPTWPIRPDCRASLGGVTRALQYANPNEATKEQVIGRINKLGGVRGKARFKAWGTGVGGQRMETHRGGSGVAKRHKKYGISTGERDNRIHTDQDTDRQRGNREVLRATDHDAKKPKLVRSRRSQKRKEAGDKVGITRSKMLIDKPHEIPDKLTPAPKLDGGEALGKKFAKKAKSTRKQRKQRKRKKKK